MIRLRFLALAAPFALGACSAAQIQTASNDIQAACTDVMPLAQLGALIPAVGSIAAGVTIGCTTAEGIARLASDPTSGVWLGMQAQMLKDAAAKAKILVLRDGDGRVVQSLAALE